MHSHSITRIMTQEAGSRYFFQNVNLYKFQIIELEFLRFDLESGNDRLCNYDRVNVFDKVNNKTQLLASLCGDELPDPIHTNSHHVLVAFESDHAVEAEGFHIRANARDTSAFSEYS